SSSHCASCCKEGASLEHIEKAREALRRSEARRDLADAALMRSAARSVREQDEVEREGAQTQGAMGSRHR
ncbi:MAG TPA: hypothetical protein VKB37_12345, partial [Jatrophihabitantaceae bacterium]|nr:hypothetical protein [Jatrophihabitantaceae bacterium]